MTDHRVGPSEMFDPKVVEVVLVGWHEGAGLDGFRTGIRTDGHGSTSRRSGGTISRHVGSGVGVGVRV